METIKYLCEFFFTNFWHWLGLWIIIGTIFVPGIVKIIKATENNYGKEETTK